MNDPASRPIGYAFALPRLLARLAGRRVRRAELSGGEAYGLGLLVFGISCVFVARLLLPFLGSVPLQGLVLFFLPCALWVAFLILYFLNSLMVAALRRLGLYSARTNNPFQHVVIMSLTTGIALHFLGDECEWVRALGVFWLGLLGANLLSIVVLRILREEAGVGA